MTASSSSQRAHGDEYERLRSLLAGVRLPAAFVELDALERNVQRIATTARNGGKRLRVASKSVRSVDLLRRIVSLAGPVAIGLMTYDARETAFLADNGFEDLLLAYPTAQREDVDLLAGLARRGIAVSVVVDDVAHLDALDAAGARAGATVSVLIDVDVSYRPLGARTHVGVRRSPLRSARDVVAMAEVVGRHAHLALAGVMAYEAQIAGLPDRGGSRVEDLAKRALKRLSRKDVEYTRAAIAAALRTRGTEARIFNGGGTGNIEWTSAEASLTEITAGSGFLCSHLFDGYRDLALDPAAFFALRVVRAPASGVVTCHGGGYVASGAAGASRLPKPVLPHGLALISLEGAGEVQTPLTVSYAPSHAHARSREGGLLSIGDPVIFRHAKAGELAEHFEEYLLLRRDRIEGRAKTYRGDGRCFLG